MKTVFVGIALLVKINSYSQTPESFNYQAKPISPQALMLLFPDLSGETYNDSVVNLQDSLFTLAIQTDTARPKSKDWMSQYNRYRCGIPYVGGFYGFIDYIVVGKIQDKFVVLSRYNAGGSLTEAYVFILLLEGSKIRKVGGFETQNIRDYSVTIKGREVINGANRYKVRN